MASPRKPAPRKDKPALTAIYARISEDSDDEEEGKKSEKGVKRQIEDCTDLCVRRGWTALPPFVDNNISASEYATKPRPRYDEMMKLVRSGDVDRVVCYDVDRLYRRPADLVELIDLADAGLSVVSMSGDLDLSTGDGRFIARILVSMAAKSSDDTSRRLRRQRKSLRDQGMVVKGKNLFGWVDRMTPDPYEAEVLCDAVQRVLTGDSLASIARLWNDTGVPHRYGGKVWGASHVKRVLANPRHAGLLTYMGEVVGDAAWPAIVDRVTFERMKAVLDGRTGHLIGIPHGQWFLSKLLTCGRCGHNLFKARSNGKPCWCCPKPEFGGCGRITVQAHQVEPLVLRTLFAYVDGLELADLVAEGDSDLRADIMTRLAEMDLKATEYRDMLHCGELDRRGYGQLVDRVNSDRADLTDRLGELSSHSVLSDYAGQPGTLEDEWSQPEMTVDRQRAIINAALAPIVVVASRTRGPKWDTERVRFGAKQQAAEAFLRHQERIA